MWPNPQETADLVIFTEEILNRILHFLRGDGCLTKWNASLTAARKHLS